MAKYYVFLLIASICWFTVLCVNAASSKVTDNPRGTDADPFNGNLKTLYEEMAKIDQSSNPFITLFRAMAKKGIASFEKDNQFIQDAVTKGTEMEKKIQSISDTLKNSNMTLPAALLSELEDIEKHAAAEFKKLKELEDVKDIEEMHKRYNTKYTEFKRQIEALSNFALEQMEKEAAQKKVQSAKAQQVHVRNAQALIASESTSTKDSDSFKEKAKAKVMEFITTWVPVAFSMKKDVETISKKIDVASSALSNIRNDLIKVKQMEYHFLRAHKDLFKTDVSSLTRSSMAQFAFAILFGMLF